MRRIVLGLLLLPLPLLLLPAGTSHAGVPAPLDTDGVPCDPMLRSVWELAPGPSDCQHRFSVTGSLDELVVLVTLRDCFDTPVPGCPIEATLKPNAQSLAFCACEDPVQTAVSDPFGAVEFRYARIGGRGSLSVGLTLLCIGAYGFPDLEAEFTSPDLDGSCEPGSSTSVVDLGLWAGGLFQYVQTSDYDCSGDITITDLGLWAHGLGIGCP